MLVRYSVQLNRLFYRHTHRLFLSRVVSDVMNKMLGHAGLLLISALAWSYRRSLTILRPRCIQHHIKAALLFSRDSPATGYGAADPAKHAVIRRQQFVPYPYTSGYYGQSFSDGRRKPSAPGHIPCALRAWFQQPCRGFSAPSGFR